MSALKYRPDIDGLRALAVFSVVFYHASPQNLPGGFLGVDIFFVISGYLISLIVFRDQAAGTFSFVDFYVRRIRRLFPALAAVLLAVLVLGAFALFADEYRRLGKHALASIVFLLNFQLMNEAGYFDVVSDAKPLLHLWSLSIEEQFYLLWPALVIMFGRFRWRVGLMISLLIISSLVFTIYLTESSRDILYFHPIARFWELLLGAALAYYHHRFGVNALPSKIDKAWIRHTLSVIGFSAIIWAVFRFNNQMPHPGILTLIPLFGAVLLIASGNNAITSRVLALQLFVWIGLISYPLYLWHWPVLSYIRIMESGTPSKTLLFAGVCLAIVLAGLTYKFIEKPLHKIQNVRYTLLSLIAAMAVLFIVSISVVVTDGLPDRPSVAYVKAAELQMKREPSTDKSCQALFPENIAPAYCRQHNPSQKMLGIIGDSHAHVLFPGFAEQAAKAGYGVLLLANSGCPPLSGAVTGKTEKERKECASAVEKILSAILADGRIEHVVIATRGPIYITGKGYGPAEADYDAPPITYENLTDKQFIIGVDPFMEGLKTTIRRLYESGRSVSYLLQVPELGVPSRNCLGRPLALTIGKTCSVVTTDYLVRMKDYRAILSGMKDVFPDLMVWDPQPLLCDAIRCQGVIKNKLMYADDDHLSVEGARLVGAHFFSELQVLKHSLAMSANQNQAQANQSFARFANRDKK